MQYQNPTITDRLRECKQLVLYLLSFVVVVEIQSLLVGDGNIRGQPPNALGVVRVIVQSPTTTGYGQDAPWDSLFVRTLVVIAQFTGIAYLFISLSLFIRKNSRLTGLLSGDSAFKLIVRADRPVITFSGFE